MPPPPVSSGITSPASLYVGELDPGVSEAMLFEIFNMIESVMSIRVCRDAVTRRSLGYAYVNYLHSIDGERALDQLNYSIIENRPCRIMWSQRDPALRKTGQGSIFIKNLDEGIDNKALHTAFAAFRNVFSCKVATDEIGNSRRHGFVHYETAESAEAAIKAVNGMLLNDKQVFVGPFLSQGLRFDILAPGLHSPALGIQKRQSQIDEQKPQLTHLYVKNFDIEASEADFTKLFERFGAVSSAILKTDANSRSCGFGFVSYQKHEDAEKAINEVNEKYYNGKRLHVSYALRRAERSARSGYTMPYGPEPSRYPPRSGRSITPTRVHGEGKDIESHDERITPPSQIKVHENCTQKLCSLEAELREKEKQVLDLTDADRQNKQQLSTSRDEVLELRRQLQQIRDEHAHVDGTFFPISSSDGIGVPAKQFLAPFHPVIDSLQNKVMTDMYRRIQLLESQALAERWRASSFAGVCQPNDQVESTNHINLIAQEFVEDKLGPLLAYFFGEEADIWLEDQHSEDFTRLFRMAWDWNSTVKGDVVMLGDFLATCYGPSHGFDSSTMTRLDFEPHNSHQGVVSGTLSLGLLVSRAIGNGKTPEVTVALKAVVAT
ncbi:Protein phosphatase PP2A regulatory subunit B [Ceratobasidium sp. 392]|nr:Protein phosphatase PP2A regulatory subunit B [Ceratobasidium sp. 392]